MKKQTKQRSGLKMFLTLLFVMAGLFIALFLTGVIINPKPHFIAYKEECHNESTPLQFKQDFTKIDCPNMSEFYGCNCYHANDGGLIVRECYITQKTDKLDCTGYEPNLVCEPHTDSYVELTYYAQGFISKDAGNHISGQFYNPHVVCQKVSVDEINDLVTICLHWASFDSPCGNYYTYETKIKVKDITEDWLNENCICKEGQPNNGNKNCLKWKCQEYWVVKE